MILYQKYHELADATEGDSTWQVYIEAAKITGINRPRINRPQGDL